MEKKISTPNIRIIGQDKSYWENQMKKFADSTANNIVAVDFGKQDIRGGFSITYFDERHCVPAQKYFESKQMMLGFIQGYNEATN